MHRPLPVDDLELPDGEDSERRTAEIVACEQFLRHMPLFAELDRFIIRRLAEMAQELEFEASDVVIREGRWEARPMFYVIQAGFADVTRTNPDGSLELVDRMGPGRYFGELGLLTSEPRTTTITAGSSEPLITYAFNAPTFHRLIADHVLRFRHLRNQHRNAQAEADTRTHLDRLGVLEGLDASTLADVLAGAEERQHAAGEAVFTEGDEADRFYVVLDGSMTAEADGAQIAWLGPGDFFGETALLFNTPRTATVRALRPARTWSISRGAFQHLLRHHLLERPDTQQTVMTRIAEMIDPDQLRDHAS